MSGSDEGVRLLGPDLAARVQALAERYGVNAADILRDALEMGRSLAWQEEWFKRLEEGVASAERGDFADEGEIEAVLNRYKRT